MHALFALLLQNFWFVVELAPAALSVFTRSFVDAKKRLVVTVYHIVRTVCTTPWPYALPRLASLEG